MRNQLLDDLGYVDLLAHGEFVGAPVMVDLGHEAAELALITHVLDFLGSINTLIVLIYGRDTALFGLRIIRYTDVAQVGRCLRVVAVLQFKVDIGNGLGAAVVELCVQALRACFTQEAETLTIGESIILGTRRSRHEPTEIARTGTLLPLGT